MSVAVRIDTREPNLRALLESYHQNSPQKDAIALHVEPLDIGDALVEFGSTCIVFERKTCADLASSLKDGRYKEQKVRQLTKTLPRHVVYLLEGAPSPRTLLEDDFPVFGLKPSVLSGMMVHTMLRDGIHVVRTSSTEETSSWIWTVALKCASNPQKIEAEGGSADAPANYLQHVKVKKIDNITPSHCYIMQLCQIPNISVSIAREIAKAYPTMVGLLTALSQLSDAEARTKLLSEIPMIGKKRALTILGYLLPPI